MVTLEELERVLERFYSPDANNDEKRVIEQELWKLREQDNSVEFACGVLEKSSSQYALWFASSVLEHVVHRRWPSTRRKKEVREFLFQYLVNKGQLVPKMVVTKISKVLVDIAKLDWPEQYPDFFEVLKRLCRDSNYNSRATGLQLLLLLMEEFNSESSKVVVSSKRKHDLRRLLREEVGDIISILESILRIGSSSSEIQQSNKEEAVLTYSFEIMLQLMSWAPLNQCFTPKITDELFNYVRLFRNPHSVQALSCINELLDRNYIPKDVQEFVLKVSLCALDILKVLAQNTNLLDEAVDGFINQYTRFLSVFLRKNLRTVESSPSFPNQQFIELLSAYSLAQQDAEDFLHCLEIWQVYIKDVAEGPNRPATPLYLNALQAFMRKLLDRVLWSQSQDILECISDDTPQPLEGTEVRADVLTASAKLHSRRTETELEAYLRRVVDAIGEIALLPDPSQASGLKPLLIQAGQLLSDTLPRISGVLSNASGGANENTLNAVSDVTWLFATFSRVSHCLAFPTFFQELFEVPRHFIQWSVEVLERLTTNRMFSHGRRFLNLHVACLRLLSASSPWLKMLGLLQNSVIQTHEISFDREVILRSRADIAESAAQFDNLVVKMLELGLGSLDARLSPPPEEVSVAAIELLDALGSKVAPRQFHSYAPLRSLAQSLPIVSGGLPIEARSLLYVALSQSILTPLAVAKGPEDPVWKEHNAFYQELIGSESVKLCELVSQLAQAPNPNMLTHHSERCRPHLCILTELAYSVNNERKVVKDFVAPVVLKSLPSAVQLITLLLSPAQQLASMADQQAIQNLRKALGGSMATAREALDFIVASLQAFGKQAGTQTCQDTVSALVNLFSAHATAKSIAEFGTGGVLLLLKLFRLLAVLMDEPTPIFKDLLPKVLTMCFNDLQNIIDALTAHAQAQHGGQQPSGPPESVLDLLEVQYDLLHKILLQHWKTFFFVSSNTMTPTGLTRELAFSSDQSKAFFFDAMNLLLKSFQREGVTPNLMKRNLSIFDDLNNAHRLFDQKEFRFDMRPAFITTLLHLLLSSSHQLLEEELLETVFGLASVDFESFYTAILPSFVRDYIQSTCRVSLSDSQLAELLASLPRQTDMPSFTLNFHSFTNDLRFYISNIN